MEGNDRRTLHLSNPEQPHSEEIITLMDNYRKTMSRNIDKIIDHIITPDNIKDCIKDKEKKNIDGKTKLFCEMTRKECKNELEGKMKDIFAKIQLQALDHAIFKEKYCSSVEECSFDEEEQYLKQLYKSLKKKAANLKDLCQKQAKEHPLQ